jgi:undecaprenyl diphosphate synthase
VPSRRVQGSTPVKPSSSSSKGSANSGIEKVEGKFVKTNGKYTKVENLHHVAFLVDGHRRWAKMHGLPNEAGYRKIIDILPPLLTHCWNIGIHTVTVWLLTYDNLKRPKDQLDVIYKVYNDLMSVMLQCCQENQAKVVHLGRKDRIAPFLSQKIVNVEEATKNNSRCLFGAAIDYSGREEISRSIDKLKKQGMEINMDNLDRSMDLSNEKYPSPDLIIRPGDAYRLSGYMCWLSGFAELSFSKKLFPDYTLEDFTEALDHFYGSERRFGV